MVGVGPEGVESALARVSLVNYDGVVILDRYVRPRERVTDFRTEVSGIEPHHLKTAQDFKQVQQQVADIIKDRILVGHALQHDLKALLLSHPPQLMRDTSKFKQFRKEYSNGRTPALKKLAKGILRIDFQDQSHSSVEDARVAMLLYRHVQKTWEQLKSKQTYKLKKQAEEKNTKK